MLNRKRKLEASPNEGAADRGGWFSIALPLHVWQSAILAAAESTNYGDNLCKQVLQRLLMGDPSKLEWKYERQNEQGGEPISICSSTSTQSSSRDAPLSSSSHVPSYRHLAHAVAPLQVRKKAIVIPVLLAIFCHLGTYLRRFVITPPLVDTHTLCLTNVLHPTLLPTTHNTV